MNLNKKKIIALALAVCLLAILSFSSLAWFTDQDSVTNEFLIAGSEDSDPDDIFSVDVWEEGDDEDDGLTYEKILPGDTLDKVAHVKNTGSYDQYIRVKITVSHAAIWQADYQANMVPVTEFVNVDLTELYGIVSEQEGDSFVYYLYYNDILPVGGDMTVFTEAYVAEQLTRDQAATLSEGYTITVSADAVQTENVGANVYEAFRTVGMELPVNTVYASDREALLEAFAGGAQYIVLTQDVKCNQAHRIQGTSAELYLDGVRLATAPGGLPAGTYGVMMSGDLALSGNGVLELNAGDMQIGGELTVYGCTIEGQGEIFDANGQQIVLP